MVLSSCISDAPYKLDSDDFVPEPLEDGWSVANASEHGIPVEPLFLIQEELFSEEQFFNTKSLLIARGGDLIFESYIRDRAHRSSLGHVQSVTKSVTSLLLGKALEQGVIDSLSQPLKSLIPEVFPSNSRKQPITLRHLLTMRSGLDIDNSVFSVRMYVDQPTSPIEYILGLPLYDDPGETFYYRDCDPYLVSYVIGTLTGGTLEQYADENLFRPLGIEDFHWGMDHQGTSMGGHGLHLKPRDLLKLGQLVLNRGEWHGQEIVDQDWIDASTSLQVNTPTTYGWDYGYYWWMVPEWNGFTAWGHGGNFIMVLPDYDMVLVLTSMPDTNDELVGTTLDQFENLIRPLMDTLLPEL